MTTYLLDTLAAAILVVEDSDEDFDTLRDAAARAGVTRVIHRVLTGGDCLALLRGEGGLVLPVSPVLPVLPALILMDLNSHGVDGREALVAIKSDERLKEIPVVVLTTSASPKDMAFCYQAGANAYHVKPVRHDQYLLLLGAILRYWIQSVTQCTTALKAD